MLEKSSAMNWIFSLSEIGFLLHVQPAKNFADENFSRQQQVCPPVDLYLIVEKSNCKNQFWQTGFLACKLIFASYTGSKNQVWDRLKIQFVKLDFSKSIFQKSSADHQPVCDVVY